MTVLINDTSGTRQFFQSRVLYVLPHHIKGSFYADEQGLTLAYSKQETKFAWNKLEQFFVYKEMLHLKFASSLDSTSDSSQCESQHAYILKLSQSQIEAIVNIVDTKRKDLFLRSLTKDNFHIHTCPTCRRELALSKERKLSDDTAIYCHHCFVMFRHKKDLNHYDHAYYNIDQNGFFVLSVDPSKDRSYKQLQSLQFRFLSLLSYTKQIRDKIFSHIAWAFFWFFIGLSISPDPLYFTMKLTFFLAVLGHIFFFFYQVTEFATCGGFSLLSSKKKNAFKPKDAKVERFLHQANMSHPGYLLNLFQKFKNSDQSLAQEYLWQALSLCPNHFVLLEIAKKNLTQADQLSFIEKSLELVSNEINQL